MGTVIDFYTARPLPPVAKAEARCRCTLCGADLWHISASGEVCCADCETVCPYRIDADTRRPPRRVRAGRQRTGEPLNMADFKFIACEEQGDVLRIAINRPPYNVLDIATMEEMNTALDMAMDNKTAKVLVITGNGDKTFSSGVDVMDHTPDKVVKMIDVFHGLLKRLMLVPIPTVAVVNGPALGGGCELAIACDMVVASERPSSASPRSSSASSRRSPRSCLPRQVPMTKVMELLLGGGIIDAKEAHRIGMVNAVFPAENFAADAGKYLEQFTTLSRVALLHTKKAVKEAANAALLRSPAPRRAPLPARADGYRGCGGRPEFSFMEKRKPVWKNK
jgi:cyclohexa-1,5-dienecarbonyl-CoA hydratase